MRSILWLVVIAFSVCALAGGYFSGNAAVPRITLHFPSPDPLASTNPIDVRPIRGLDVPQTDEVALDDFADDPAVVSGAVTGDIQHEAHLALVLVGCGHSFALEAPFLSLEIPVTLVIDPDGPAANAIAQAAAAAGKATVVQIALPFDPSQLPSVHANFPHARAVAARFEDVPPRALLRALRAQRLAAFDEFGEDKRARAAMRAAGIQYVSRTITVDDHLQPAYVQYMLDQAVDLGRAAPAVVLARPLPGTLRALQALIAQSSRDGVSFEPAVQ